MSVRFGPLWRHADFLRLWSAQAVSAFGSRITRTALPAIAILVVAADPMEIAVLSSLEIVPAVLVGLLAGGFIDRSDKRPVLVFADVARAILVVSVPVAAWVSGVTMIQLYVVAALAGACSALFRLADNAYLPALIGRERLVEGNSKLEATDSLAEIGGPGLAGVLIQVLTAPVAMIIDGLSYLWSAALLLRIRSKERRDVVPSKRPSIIDDVRIGVRAGFGHPTVGPTFWSFAIGDLFNGFFMALYMLFALETLSLDVATVGIVIGLGGVGALGGAFVAGALSRTLGLGAALIVTLVLGKLSNVFVPLAGVYRDLAVPLLSAAQLLGDGCLVAFLILANSYRQAILPLDVMARANGTLQVMTGVLLPAGALIAGLLATTTSVTTAVWTGMLGGLLAVGPLLRPAVYRLVSMPA